MMTDGVREVDAVYSFIVATLSTFGNQGLKWTKRQIVGSPKQCIVLQVFKTVNDSLFTVYLAGILVFEGFKKTSYFVATIRVRCLIASSTVELYLEV